MDLRGVRYFNEVARTGSIVKAADRLHIAPSAVSRRIALLEEEFGVCLFDRTSHGMLLTIAGELYLEYARGAVLDLDRVRSELDDLKGLRRGLVRIVSIEGVVPSFVTHAILDFRTRYPGVHFDLSVGGSDLVAKSVRAGEADIGIAGNFGSSDLRTVLRVPTPLLAVMSPKYPLATARTVDFLDVLANNPVAVPNENFAIRHQLDAYCARAGFVLLPVLVTNSIDALRRFARLGGGVTFLPSVVFGEDLERGTLTGVKLKGGILDRSSIDICVLKARKLSVAANEFLQSLKVAATASSAQ